jgi:tetratricopeptide (TPR) repeat protein
MFANTAVATESDTLLYNIQSKIYGAFLASFQDNGITRLEAIENQIKKLSVQSPTTSYWIAYAKYYEAVYFIKFKNQKQCQKTIASAIGLLENIKNKNSETYALIAFIQSFSIQLSGGMSAAGIAAKVKRNAETAIQLDSTNIRAWYVLASNDYYTPSAFGGGGKCEKYLLKAMSLEEQLIPNPYLPSWGKSDVYSLLIAHYIDKGNYAKAREYIAIALSLYPDNYMISQYVEMLKDKE